MHTKFYSQRQFTKLAGISSATLSKMIKEGFIKLEPNGSIAYTELRKLILRTLQKERKDNVLVLVIGDSDTTQNIIPRLQEAYSKKDGVNKPYYDSVDSLITDFLSKNLVDLDVQLLDVSYTEYMSKLFYSKYKELVQSYFINCVTKGVNNEDDVDIREIPSGVVYDLIAYGESDIDFELTPYSTINTTLQLQADDKFKVLMKKLSFTDKDNNLLFSRTDLTSEIMKDSASFYKFLTTKLPKASNTLNQSYAYLPNKIDKYFNTLYERKSVANIKFKLTATANDGFFVYSTYDFKPSTDDELSAAATLKVFSFLSTELMTGVFTEVLINCTKTEFETYIPDVVRNLLRSYENTGLKLTFIKEG